MFRDLPSDPDELRAFAQALQDRLATVEQAHVTTAAELASTAAALRAVTGKAEVVRDLKKAKSLWNAGIEAWFPEGPEDPDIVLLKVQADGAEYWDTAGAGVVSVLFFVKAKVTGRPYHIGHHKVEL